MTRILTERFDDAVDEVLQSRMGIRAADGGSYRQCFLRLAEVFDARLVRSMLYAPDSRPTMRQAESWLQRTLREVGDLSINMVDVDMDTSTSDTCLMFATGAAAMRGQKAVENAGDPALAEFTAATHDLLRELAIMVAKDGEGVSKFVTLKIEGAESNAAARVIGMSIANSPLVKTAIAGEDPNWGRIVMAVGKAGEAADRDNLSIWFGDTIVASKGERAPSYDEPSMAKYMKNREIEIRVDVGAGGKGKATIWTCDLTHDYISINADYRS